MRRARNDLSGLLLDGVRRIRALMPACDLRIYEGVGHAIAAEAPERLAGDIAAFLAGAPAAR